ncbi:MAG TPA: hypothetical protein VFZ59_27225 [Verrucomicrobiae bacterium]|nr:hypothetical protein [Verrucomicrobiae bacterium]
MAAVILVALVLLVRLAVKSRNEPVVRGLSLSEWMQLEDKNSDEYRAAVAEMDERCVRWLIHELDWSPTSMQTKVDGLMFRIVRQPVAPEIRPDYRAAAALTLSKLGSRAQPAIPALRITASISGSSYGDWEAQRMAVAALVLLGADSLDAWVDQLLNPTNRNWQFYVDVAGFLHTNGAPIVPRLAHTFETTADNGIKLRITESLRFIRSNPTLCVPIFRAALTSDDDRMVFTALVGLYNFGPEAKPAWDDLLPFLADDRGYQTLVTNALRQIDPEAAEQLGIR